MLLAPRPSGRCALPFEVPHLTQPPRLRNYSPLASKSWSSRLRRDCIPTVPCFCGGLSSALRASFYDSSSNHLSDTDVLLAPRPSGRCALPFCSPHHARSFAERYSQGDSDRVRYASRDFPGPLQKRTGRPSKPRPLSSRALYSSKIIWPRET
jgi:hypothetical protein